MNVIINGHNIKISDALEDYAHKKLTRLDRYLPNISEIKVDLSRQTTKRGANFAIAQITLRHGRGAILRSEEKLAIEDHDTIRAALANAVDKMYSRISRFKGKRRSKQVRERYKATFEELEAAEELPEAEEEIEIPEFGATEDVVEIVRRKEVSLSAMHEEDAIEQMELLGHDFFMFFNIDTNSVNVLYRRAAEGYGVLVPQIE